jgi:hypothetical protein
LKNKHKLTKTFANKSDFRYNKINESLRIFSKFLEKDVHNALSFYVFDDLAKALEFTEGSSVTVPTIGNCVLFVQERGMVEGGRGVIYHVGEELPLNGQDCYPLHRALVTFSPNADTGKVINETKDTLINLTVGYLPKLNTETTESGEDTNISTDDWPQFFSQDETTGIFYTNARKRAGENYPYVAGCRRGLFVGTRLIQPGFRGVHAETLCNFCFFSRNPRF